MTVHRLAETRSTNLAARNGRPGEVWTAEYQTAGRGRLDHVWQSARGVNLMFSTVLDVSGRPPEEVATLPLVVGLAVLRALETFTSAPLTLKWPNDVLANGRKICGILCERADDRVIAGVGINVNQRAFPANLRTPPTSLALENGAAADRETVLAAALDSLFSCVDLWRARGFAALLPEVAERDYLRGRVVALRQTDTDAEPLTGLCDGIAPDGSLLVGGRRVYAGEAQTVESREHAP